MDFQWYKNCPRKMNGNPWVEKPSFSQFFHKGKKMLGLESWWFQRRSSRGGQPCDEMIVVMRSAAAQLFEIDTFFFRLFAKWMYYCNSYSYSKTVSDPSFKEKNKETFYLNHRVPPQLTRTLTPVSEMTVMHEWRMNYFFENGALDIFRIYYFYACFTPGKKKRSDEAIQLASKGKLD